MYNFNEYQEFIRRFDRYPKSNRFDNLVCGVCSEAGEIAGITKKHDRDQMSYAEFRNGIIKELGDVLWYVARLADHFNVPLSEVASLNVQKLLGREERGTINGNGDNR